MLLNPSQLLGDLVPAAWGGDVSFLTPFLQPPPLLSPPPSQPPVPLWLGRSPRGGLWGPGLARGGCYCSAQAAPRTKREAWGFSASPSEFSTDPSQTPPEGWGGATGRGHAVGTGGLWQGRGGVRWGRGGTCDWVRGVQPGAGVQTPAGPSPLPMPLCPLPAPGDGGSAFIPPASPRPLCQPLPPPASLQRARGHAGGGKNVGRAGERAAKAPV